MSDTMLVIEDEALLGDELSHHFCRLDWEVLREGTLAGARRSLLEQELEPLVVLTDMNLPDGNALDLLDDVRRHPGVGEWIVLTAYGSVPDSVRAMQLGAFDFLEKPCEFGRLDLVVTGAARSARAHRRLRDHAISRIRRFTPASFVGTSAAARGVRRLLRRLVEVPFSALLIGGETGTGKGIAARILHHSGPRSDGPLVEVNCAALPTELMESELFGHEPGAFTGASKRRRGMVEQAQGGTLFLDEVGELGNGPQAKLLKMLEDRTIRRLGGEREVQVDVQIVAASNRDLDEQVEQGHFRRDLLHRLNAFRLDIPPLRERVEDLEELVPLFVAEFNASADRHVEVIPDGVWGRLRAHRWPGNVRELRNAVERCVLLAEGEVFPQEWLHLERRDDAPVDLGSQDDPDVVRIPLDGSLTLDEMERALLLAALRRTGHNVAATARLLRTTRETVRYRIQKFGLDSDDPR